jgi:hypothetical protein
VTIDATGCLVVNGAKLFPIGFSDGPYYNETQDNPPAPPSPMTTPDGKDALAELASAGGNMIRIGMGKWASGNLTDKLKNQQAWLEAAAARNMFCWLWLGELPNLPASGSQSNEQLLRQIATTLRPHPALLAYKGIDEPANFFRGKNKIPAAGMKRAYDVLKLKQVDPDHPVVVIQSPRSVGNLATYAPALDVTGADIFPVSYPPGVHLAEQPNEDIGIVGDVTQTMVTVAKGKPVWMTLQIAWSGVVKKDDTLRFPTFQQQRFMAYQAIVQGARGLVFFGGHLTQVGVRPMCRQVDIAHGWNWTFWNDVLRAVVEELSAHSLLQPALVLPNSNRTVTCRLLDATGKVTSKTAADIQFVVRETPTAVFLIAVKRGGQTVRVQFQFASTKLRPHGYVLFEEPRQIPISQAAGASTFTDWFAPYDVHVYKIGFA